MATDETPENEAPDSEGNALHGDECECGKRPTDHHNGTGEYTADTYRCWRYVRATHQGNGEVTAEALARAFKTAYPDLTFGHHDDRCVGVWNHEMDRFELIRVKAITREWVELEYETFANGKPGVAGDEWIDVLGPTRQGIIDGIIDAWTIGQKPKTNGYTEEVYCKIKDKYEGSMEAEMFRQATLYQISYMDGFDAVAVKRGFTGKEKHD